VSPVALLAVSTTTAWLFAVALDWVIEHDCVMPVVLMQFAVFVASVAAAVWTTAQREVAHWKTFLPAPEAT
jgi:uncharacterized membrane protein